MGSNWCSVKSCFCGRTGAYFPNPERGKITDDEQIAEKKRLADWIEFCGQEPTWKPDVRHQFVGWLHFNQAVVKECTRMKNGREQRLRKLNKDARPTIRTTVDKDGVPHGGELPDWYVRIKESLGTRRSEAILGTGTDSRSSTPSTIKSSTPAPTPPKKRRRPPAKKKTPAQAMISESDLSLTTTSTDSSLTTTLHSVGIAPTGSISGMNINGIPTDKKMSYSIDQENLMSDPIKSELQELKSRVQSLEAIVAQIQGSPSFQTLQADSKVHQELENANYQLQLKDEEARRMWAEIERLNGTIQAANLAPSTSDVAHLGQNPESQQQTIYVYAHNGSVIENGNLPTGLVAANFDQAQAMIQGVGGTQGVASSYYVSAPKMDQ